MQRERVQDQYPWTWEIPAAVAAGVALVVVWSWHVGRAIANLLAGAGWGWPTPAQWFASLPGLLGGDAAAGVQLAGPAASATGLWLWMVLTTVVTLTVGTAAAVWAWRRWGTGGLRGMATVDEARAVLGVDRLARVRHVVRPDLYPARRRSPR
jgi:hypothetical protein